MLACLRISTCASKCGAQSYVDLDKFVPHSTRHSKPTSKHLSLTTICNDKMAPTVKEDYYKKKWTLPKLQERCGKEGLDSEGSCDFLRLKLTKHDLKKASGTGAPGMYHP